MNTNTQALASHRPLASLLWPLAAAFLARLASLAEAALRAASLGADELRGMSDHELKDLGLGRSEVGNALEHGRG